ncbi:lipocalin-like domain-containing protein [Saccharopolyspora taberi]|uniref:Lipocalin-like domain-containing protein n=1 Tax=Saccharopolyspora taberi TaxID=60895 RepID=A0ABN3V402_9PSEU
MDELVGAWRLVDFRIFAEDGELREGPLGSRPTGLLVYDAAGHVAVNMMRTDAGEGTHYMSYAGTWRREGDQVVHSVSIAPDQSWLGTEQVRSVELDGDRLTLIGRGLRRNAKRSALEWQRLNR